MGSQADLRSRPGEGKAPSAHRGAQEESPRQEGSREGRSSEGRKCVHAHPPPGHVCMSMCANVCTHTTPSRQNPPPRVGETKWGRGGHQAAAEPPGARSRPVAFSLVYGTSSSGIILAPRGKRADVFLKGGVRHNRYRLHKSSDVSFCQDSAVPLKNKLKPDGKGGRDKAGPQAPGSLDRTVTA